MLLLEIVLLLPVLVLFDNDGFDEDDDVSGGLLAVVTVATAGVLMVALGVVLFVLVVVVVVAVGVVPVPLLVVVPVVLLP